jgi:hypothetical protein
MSSGFSSCCALGPLWSTMQRPPLWSQRSQLYVIASRAFDHFPGFRQQLDEVVEQAERRALEERLEVRER